MGNDTGFCLRQIQEKSFSMFQGMFQEGFFYGQLSEKLLKVNMI